MNIVEQPEVSKPQSPVAQLDRLLLIVENIKLLLICPLVVGLIAWGICWVVPQSYTSLAILAVPTPPLPVAGKWQTQVQSPTQAAAMLVSPLVIDPVIASLKLADDRHLEDARKKLMDKIRTSVGRDNLLRLEVTADSPVKAQSMANTLIENWLKTTVPGERERADLEKRLTSAKTSLEVVNRILVSLADGGKEALGKPVTRGEAGTGIVAVGELQGQYLTDTISIARSLQGLSRDVIAQAPTLPIDPSAPKKTWIATAAVVTSMLLLVFWVFARQSWRLAAADPQVAQKQDRLARALGLKKA